MEQLQHSTNISVSETSSQAFFGGTLEKLLRGRRNVQPITSHNKSTSSPTLKEGDWLKKTYRVRRVVGASGGVSAGLDTHTDLELLIRAADVCPSSAAICMANALYALQGE
ncbi:unnamed protein product [Arctogadus glacialis]